MMTPETKGERGPKGRAYDEKVSPLVAQIIEICKEHNINMFATFSLGVNRNGETYFCTTSAPFDVEDSHGADIVETLWRVVHDGWTPSPPVIAMTITTGSKMD